jgi:hypothetical protein
MADRDPSRRMTKKKKMVLGWREWVDLPELGIRHIKAKVDTGARTSALHAFEVQPFTENGRQRVRFKIHPNQKDVATVVESIADVVDQRVVTDSGGHREERWVIETRAVIGGVEKSIELTLTSRDTMMFRMLLGRTALKGWARVDPGSSYLAGKPGVTAPAGASR